MFEAFDIQEVKRASIPMGNALLKEYMDTTTVSNAPAAMPAIAIDPQSLDTVHHYLPRLDLALNYKKSPVAAYNHLAVANFSH